MRSSGNEIAKILDAIQGFDTYTVISDFFAMSAIAVRNNVDFGREWQAYEDRYKAIVKKYNKTDLQAFVRALAVFQGWIGQAIDGQIEFRDFAGELYMDSGTSNGKAGQFFTPFSVSSVMAEVDLDTDRMKKELEEDPDKVITIYEPTCGAGGIIVAAIDKLRRENINYSWNVFVDCGDIEQNCQKYAGNEDKFDRCISHLRDTVLEILGGRDAAKNNRLSGQVPAETCFRICMDYFNDEVWKAEDEEEAKKKAAKTSTKKQNSVVAKCSVDDVTDEDDDNDDTVCETPAVQPKKKEADQLDMFAALGV